MSRQYKNVKARWLWNPDLKEMVEVPTEWRPRPVNAPYVHQDSIDAFESQADGKMYDSKSRYYRRVKELGYELTGGEKVTDGRGPVRYKMGEDDYMASAKQAWEQCQSGNAPLNEYEREVCSRVNRQLKNR